VVNRVYLAGRVEVALFAQSERAVGGSAALPGPASVEDLRALNAALGGGVPGVSGLGGALEVRMASSRAITLAETFDRPLVIGYLAFDVPILAGGRLGAAVQTRDALAGRATLRFAADGATARLERWLEEPGNYELLVEALAEREVDAAPSDVLYSAEHAALRARLVDELDVP
jgi:hypothetical protein